MFAMQNAIMLAMQNAITLAMQNAIMIAWSVVNFHNSAVVTQDSRIGCTQVVRQGLVNKVDSSL
jgi:hypothetical protein